MGIAAQQFEGISTNIPGVYTKSEYPLGLGSVVAPANVVAIIGESLGGVPHNASGKTDEEKVNVIASTGQALNALVGGPGYYMTEFFLSPTRDPQLNNPAQVLFLRANPATAAAATAKDVGTNDIIDLASTVYGVVANQLARKIEAATALGHKCTVKYRGEEIVSRDNIGYEYMEIRYVGTGSAATMTINATTLATTVTGAATDDLALTLANYKDLNELVTYINDQPAYTCTLKGSGSTNPSTFDAVTAQDIKTAVYTSVAHVQALIDFFNNECQGLLVATLHAVAIRTNVVNDTNYVFMAGGAEGTTTTSHWAACLTLLEKMDVNHILVATGDSAVHAMVADHVQAMSAIEGRKNRSAGAGAAAATTTKAARIAEMRALNSPRFGYAITPIQRNDAINNGVLTTFAPFYGAALVAGIRFGNFVTISATFKSVNAVAVTEKYSIPDQKDYISAGATLFEERDGAIVVIHEVTTFQGTNLILNLPSMLRTCDFITLDLQAKVLARLADLKRAPNALAINSIVNYVVTNVLPAYRDQGLLTDDPNTGASAFSDVQFSVVGDRFNLSFTGIVPAPLHYGFITQKFVVPGLIA